LADHAIKCGFIPNVLKGVWMNNSEYIYNLRIEMM
jgi:hypothetical protein